jgi:ABC-2 type transport system permease protein
MTEIPAPTAPTAGAPIADTSYRSYTGPLYTRAIRWWIIVYASLRMLLKRPGLWAVVVLGSLPYLFSGGLLYFQSQGWSNQIPMMAEYPQGQKYAASFFQALDSQSLWLFVLALMVGAGSIAADNRTNALLVYLSRPITKGDYLLGKWMGIFLVVFVLALLPALLLYLFCLFSYLDEGFFKHEPWLILRVIAAAAVPAAIHASLLVGFSAWSKTPRVAGASYAALYFGSGLVTSAIWLIRYHGDLKAGILMRHLSLGGIMKGLTQNIYGVTLLMPSGHRRRGLEIVYLAPPEFWVMLVVAAGLVVAGIAAARAKIRAVEVISG